MFWSGFQQYQSTGSASLKNIDEDDIRSDLNQMRLAELDFSKAFNTVDSHLIRELIDNLVFFLIDP